MEVALQGSELIANSKIIEIPIDKLKLDKDNVRFKHLQKKLSQNQMRKLIADEPDTSELCDQILAARVVYEPLVVDTHNVVIEGNRRLVSLWILRDEVIQEKLEGVSEEKFNKVKCRVLPDKVDDKTKDLYLATIHVKGKKPWKLFNRAKHIYRLNVVHGFSYDKLAEHIGMGKVTIQRNVNVYKQIVNYSRRFPDDKLWFHKFTYYDELFKRKELKELTNDKEFLLKFGKWVHDEKFHDVRDVRKLLKVVSDKDALAILEKQKFEVALKVIEEKDPSLSNQDFKKIKETIEVLKSIERTELVEIKMNAAKMKLLIALEAEIKSLLAELDAIRRRAHKS